MGWRGARCAESYRRLPSVAFIRDYAEHPAYIAALQQSVGARSPNTASRIGGAVVPRHPPKHSARTGDDYPQRCEDTLRR